MSATPALPTIGTILGLIEEAGQILTKSNDPGRGKRTLIQRFAAEKKVDFDEFGSARDMLFSGWNDLLSGLGSHWLDPARWNQVLGAYAQLARNISVLGATETTIATFITEIVASWFAMSLFRWSRSKGAVLDRLSQAKLTWFLPDSAKPAPYAAIFDDLKMGLGVTAERFYGLANVLASDESDDVRDELAANIASWCSGDVTPRLDTLRALIERRLQNRGYQSEALVFRSQIIAVSFGQALISWGDGIGSWNAVEVVGTTMVKTIEHFSKNWTEMPIIPSPRFLNDTEDYFQTTLQFKFWNGIQNASEANRAHELSISITAIVEAIIAESNDPDVESPDAKDLFRISAALRNRFGPGYARFEKLVYETARIAGIDSAIKTVHAQRTLDQMACTPYSRSKAWHRYTKNMIEGLALPISEVDFTAALNWIADYRRDRIDQLRVWGRYRRTRLMLASSSGKKEFVEALLEAGAKPSVVSEDCGGSYGDDGTALIFALQGYVNFGNLKSISTRDAYRSIVFTLIERIGKDHRTLDRTTFIRNACALSLAIEAADPEIVALLANNGASLELGIGGDELTALYYALSEYFRVSMTLRLGSDGVESWNRVCGPDVNLTRMVIPPFFANLLPGAVSQREMEAAMSEEFLELMHRNAGELLSVSAETPAQLRKIVEILLDACADKDRLQPNGRYPLDMADEIQRELGDPTMTELLERRGAAKRAL